jgi:hypothetical protein
MAPRAPAAAAAAAGRLLAADSGSSSAAPAAATSGSSIGGSFVPVVGAYSEAAMDSVFSFSRGSGSSRAGSRSSTIRHPGM